MSHRLVIVLPLLLLAQLATAVAHAQSSGNFTTVTATAHLVGKQQEANVTVNTTAVGSGKNGPSTAQVGMIVNATKDNWFSGPAVTGELDGIYITTRQGGPGSDSSGILVDVQNTGQGFLSSTEMVSNIVDPVKNVITHGIGLQDGVLNLATGQFIGRVFNANKGQLTSAMLVQNTAGAATWGNVLVNTKNGIQNFVIDDDGNLTGTRIAANRSTVLGGDAGNGSLDLGIPSTASTGYISFHGTGVSSSARIINDAVGQVTIEGRNGGAGANLQVLGTAQVGSYGYGALPQPGNPGRILLCRDCLKPGEQSGHGTGMLLFDDGHQWVTTAGTTAAR